MATLAAGDEVYRSRPIEDIAAALAHWSGALPERFEAQEFAAGNHYATPSAVLAQWS